MGTIACLGMSTTLVVSFTVMPAVLQILHDRRSGKETADEAKRDAPDAAA